jgi:diguanylate cyclase (GGDEF)-like protein/PAS domain S-box-containing protein
MDGGVRPVASPDEIDDRARREQWYRTVLANISDTVSIIDREGLLLFTSGASRGLLGYSQDFWDGLHPITLVHPDDLPIVHEGWARCAATPGAEEGAEVRMLSAEGTWQDVSVTAVNLLDDPAVHGYVITTRNVTPLRRAERLASGQAEVLELIARGEPLDRVAEACLVLLRDNGVRGRTSIYLLEDDRLELRAGAAPDSLNRWLRTAPRSPERSLCDLAIATEQAVIVPDLREVRLGDGLAAIARKEHLASAWSHPIVSITSGRPVGSLSTISDEVHEPTSVERQVVDVTASLMAIALERVETEGRLAHQALHDALTGLPNRSLLLDRLEHALARSTHHPVPPALLFCDIDRFKVINDSLGHGVGDQLLVAFAQRLQEVLSPADTVARFGGDEFVILLEDLPNPDRAAAVAEELRSALARPFALPAGKEVYLTASIGLAVPTDRHTGDAWLRDADAAMYRAKDQGRDRLATFDTAMRDAAMARLAIEHELRGAVDRGELVVLFQPVVDLASGRICGAEALVRWDHPERGLLAPSDFIRVAEEIGAIGHLGRHVLEVALATASSLRPALGDRSFQLGVNVSARQLILGDLDHEVAAALGRLGWPAADLLLEITESALITTADGALESIDNLRALGVAVAIDDFGTGHSSLERLGRLPVDQVKIDRMFVTALDDPDGRLGRIVHAVLAMADALGHQTTAEGVETQSQLDHLRRLGCHYAQGYLFSRPIDADALAELVRLDPRW